MNHNEPAPKAPSAMPQLSLAAVGSAGCALGVLAGAGGAIAATFLLSPSAAGVILGLPVLGVLGMILGVIALRRIARSEGRVVGRPLAVAGLLLGGVLTVLLGAASAGAVIGFAPVRKALCPAVDAFAGSIAQGDLVAARRVLAADASGAAGDERLIALVSEPERALGPWKQARFDVGVVIESGRRMRALAGAAPGRSASGPGTQEWPKPIALEFERGRAMAYVYVDDNGLARGHVAIRDVLVLMPDGTARALLPDGPAATTGRWLGLKGLEAPAESAASRAD